ncbi:MAG: type I methionyl aminopeptidase [Chloroflexi bacterium]|nr:type I methionyl aminopeptidase [Chloroflexota bacterium]
MRYLVLLGPPGAGKGTQAQAMARVLGVPHIASGDLFREHQSRGTELGLLAKSYMERGQLVPDEVTIRMVGERLAAGDARRGFVLDGFPRTLEQAKALDQVLSAQGCALNMVVYVKVPEEELVRRLGGRYLCRNCQQPYHEVSSPPSRSGICDKCGGELFQRPDDVPETVRKRLQVYLSQTAPLIGYYKEAGKLVEVNGNQPIEAVSRDVLSQVNPETGGGRGIVVKSERELALMRQAGRIVAEVLQGLAQALRPGMATGELDAIARREIRSRGGIPSFEGYRGYPATLCVSVNDEVVHGIPGDRVLREGDLVSLDLGAIYKGFQADAALSVGVGAVSPEVRQLMEATEGALHAGISAAKAGARVGDVSAAIQSYVEAQGFHVVREYVGHGIGREMHEEPQVPNYGLPGRGPVLRPGMALALEPMVNVGDWRTRVGENGWTVYTMDGSLSAHFEHTIVVTNGRAELLTAL